MLLGSAIAALGATVANAIGGAGRVRANTGGSVRLGFATDWEVDGFGDNEATQTTKIGTTDGHGFVAHSTDTNGGTYGVAGFVTATVNDGRGVYGESHAVGGFGVVGYAAHPDGVTRGVQGSVNSGHGTAVRALATSTAPTTLGVEATVFGPGIGVRAVSRGGTGVVGFSGSGTPPAVKPWTGVYGYASGKASVAVRGTTTTGTGGHFAAGSLLAGTALRAVGGVRLDNAAGIIVVVEGMTAATVTPGTEVSDRSAIAATAMSNTPTSVSVRRVSIDAAANAFTVHLSGPAPTGGLKVAWHLFGF